MARFISTSSRVSKHNALCQVCSDHLSVIYRPFQRPPPPPACILTLDGASVFDFLQFLSSQFWLAFCFCDLMLSVSVFFNRGFLLHRKLLNPYVFVFVLFFFLIKGGLLSRDPTDPVVGWQSLCFGLGLWAPFKLSPLHTSLCPFWHAFQYPSVPGHVALFNQENIFSYFLFGV